MNIKKITSIANYFLFSFFNFSEYPFTASKTSIGIGKKIVLDWSEDTSFIVSNVLK